ncbi:MAG TPA: hypothetical protein H9881_01000 [Candidatus Stackebrandtia excrementipullorum]|nr:hypothetical protein [Candidatus Stackebrandtia excrementipullorum]
MSVEVLAGVAVAWLWRKFKRSAGRLDEATDEVTDAAMDRLTTVVKTRLTGDPALLKLEQQAASGVEVSSTGQRVKLALQEAAEEDETFASELKQAIDALPATDSATVRTAGRDYYEITGENAQITVDNR